MLWRLLDTSVLTVLLLPVLFYGMNVVRAQVMQSNSYQIQSDSINVGGGFSTSTNYELESTAGEIATGPSDSATYSLRAGYQQMQEVYIAISGATTTFLGDLGGVTGGTSNASATITVTTDSPSGYALYISSVDSPAMQSGANFIADYVPLGDPDFVFATGDTDAHFGYSPEGIDVASRFLDDGADCNTDTGNTALACWDGLATTTEMIATDSDANHPNGATTTIHFRVGIGGVVNLPPGLYIATTTVTAIPL
ncbi:hypothetical protein KC845_01750 [Candidatus Kaiserbacteria bacterium]|nr:hypothetical protein [Candidatus Kaiserbacteria bacterium]